MFVLIHHVATKATRIESSSSLLRLARIEKAAELLTTSGITQLCHPDTDEHAPFFQKCLTVARPNQRMMKGEENKTGQKTWFYTKNCLGVLICVTMAALAAGLTIGLLSLDPLVLLIKMRAGTTEAEKKQATTLLPVVKQHHQLLVTLLLLNSIANEALPIFLDAMVPSFVAIIISVTLVLFFGEIIPSAVFTGPNQLKIASSLTPVVRLVMIILFPLAYPIARVLDIILHNDDKSGSTYNRSELAALVRILYEERMATKQRRKKERIQMAQNFNLSHPADPIDTTTAMPSDIHNTANVRSLKRETSDQESETSSRRNGTMSKERFPSIHIDEVSMVEGALQMKTKLALDVYTPMRLVFAIPFDMILSEKHVVQIYSHGFSRVPVYIPNPEKEKDKQAICGVLMTKQLIVVNMSDNRPVSTLPLHVPQCVSPKINMVDLLNLFQAGGCHLALVCTRPDIGNQALQWGLPVPETAGLLGCVKCLFHDHVLNNTVAGVSQFFCTAL